MIDIEALELKMQEIWGTGVTVSFDEDQICIEGLCPEGITAHKVCLNLVHFVTDNIKYILNFEYNGGSETYEFDLTDPMYIPLPKYISSTFVNGL